MKLGLYGGTFDPVHHGHLLLARDAVEELALDRLFFIPCHLSPHKLDQSPTPGKHRAAMLRAAIRDEPSLEVSTVEIDRSGPSYSIETVRHFQQLYPGAELFWLIGADQLPKLPQWEQFRELKRLVTFVVLARRGFPVRRRPGLFPLARRRSFDLAATEVRFRVRENLPISWLTPEPVVRYIQKNQLYRR